MVDAAAAHEVVARHVLVAGHVQGVFFRATTVRHARAAGVVGWVRNRDDDRVEAHLQGDAVDVEAIVAWMRDGGPPAARVDAVEVDEVTPINADGFTVRR
ncbi:MAG TPA: acylphosphatase [Nitriliruptoraceae bacterium]|nr:acylphosphatase [Nitriliruptoraceae bacterium]